MRPGGARNPKDHEASLADLQVRGDLPLRLRQEGQAELASLVARLCESATPDGYNAVVRLLSSRMRDESTRVTERAATALTLLLRVTRDLIEDPASPSHATGAPRLYRDRTGERIRCTPADEIGRGGEGTVYRLAGDPPQVVKIYQRPSQERSAKLRVMVRDPPADPTASADHCSIAWPVDRAVADYGSAMRVVGFVMPRVPEGRGIFSIYNPSARLRNNTIVDYRFLHGVARNLASAVAAVHACGHVIGDIKQENIRVTDKGLVSLVDTDSFQVRDTESGVVHRCPVGTLDFTPPELQDVDFSTVDREPSHDAFGLAVLIFQLLMEGRHPFAGVFIGRGEPPHLQAAIRTGLYPYASSWRARLTPPPSFPPLEIVHPELRGLFRKCFRDGHRHPRARPLAPEWFRALDSAIADMRSCPLVEHHAFGGHLASCPWCARDQLGRGSSKVETLRSGGSRLKHRGPYSWSVLGAFAISILLFLFLITRTRPPAEQPAVPSTRPRNSRPLAPGSSRDTGSALPKPPIVTDRAAALALGRLSEPFRSVVVRERPDELALQDLREVNALGGQYVAAIFRAVDDPVPSRRLIVWSFSPGDPRNHTSRTVLEDARIEFDDPLRIEDINRDGTEEMLVTHGPAGRADKPALTAIYALRRMDVSCIGDAAELTDLDGDGVPEALTLAPAMTDPATDFGEADRPRRRLVYTWREGRYELAGPRFRAFYDAERGKHGADLQASLDAHDDDKYASSAVSLFFALVDSGRTAQAVMELNAALAEAVPIAREKKRAVRRALDRFLQRPDRHVPGERLTCAEPSPRVASPGRLRAP